MHSCQDTLPPSGNAGSAAEPLRDGIGYLLGDERARRLAARITARESSPDLGVTRAVIFVTQKCNMACVYCRSIRHRMPNWKPSQVDHLLQELAASRTQHVHWTGGEASLHPQLIRWVRGSNSLGMNNSISTNGSAPTESYLKLAEAGMRRFYLSIDVVEPARFDEMTASRGRLPGVLSTLRALCDLRDFGSPIHITINTVLQGG